MPTLRGCVVYKALAVWLVSVGVGAYPVCNQATLKGVTHGEFNQLSNQIDSHFQAYHGASDVVVTPGFDAHIRGEFFYSISNLRLAGEFVELFIDDCSPQMKLLARTMINEDGHTHIVILKDAYPGVGEFRLVQRVVADGTAIESTLKVLPVGTHFVVFDVDGTLTKSDAEVIYDFLPLREKGAHSRSMATQITHERKTRQGYEVIYLSGRSYLLNKITRDWLLVNQFAPGNVYLNPAKPLGNNIEDFKAAYLKSLVDMGFVLDYAYGNQASDVKAYRRAGLSAEQIFVVGSYRPKKSALSLGHGFEQHYDNIRSEPNIVQPM